MDKRTMDEKLRNYSATPDPEVWEKISGTLRHKAIRRRTTWAAAVVGVAAIGVVALWPHRESPTAAPTQPHIAQVTTLPTPNSAAAPSAAPVKATHLQEPMAATTSTRPQTTTDNSKSIAATPATIEAAVKEATPQPLAAETPQPTEATAVASPTPAVADIPSVAVEEPAKSESPASQPSVATPPAKATGLDAPIEDTILWVPNAFAPAMDDPRTATFRAYLNKTETSILNFRMSIFNRRGHQVFHSTDINQAWDGTYKGQPLPQGGYVYVIYFVDKDGFTHQRKGTVALIR